MTTLFWHGLSLGPVPFPAKARHIRVKLFKINQHNESKSIGEVTVPPSSILTEKITFAFNRFVNLSVSAGDASAHAMPYQRNRFKFSVVFSNAKLAVPGSFRKYAGCEFDLGPLLPKAECDTATFTLSLNWTPRGADDQIDPPTTPMSVTITRKEDLAIPKVGSSSRFVLRRTMSQGKLGELVDLARRSFQPDLSKFLWELSCCQDCGLLVPNLCISYAHVYVLVLWNSAYLSHITQLPLFYPQPITCKQRCTQSCPWFPCPQGHSPSAPERPPLRASLREAHNPCSGQGRWRHMTALGASDSPAMTFRRLMTFKRKSCQQHQLHARQHQT